MIVSAIKITGPTIEVNEELHQFDLNNDLDKYLAESEAKFSDLISGTEKKIKWANSPGEKTELAFVYLHGFSATRQETAPLTDDLAKEIGANLFYTRLTGHGRDGEAMAEASVNDWLNDTWEAIKIGEEIGDKVIVMGTSTGGTLATWLAAQNEIDQISALVLLSPNYEVQNSMAELIASPFLRPFKPVLDNWEQSFESVNRDHQRYWTRDYPVTAIFPMMDLLRLTEQIELEKIDKPIQIIYSPADQVVKPDKIETVFAKLGSKKKRLVTIDSFINEDNHVLAGDILAPDNTKLVKDKILDFLGGIINE